MAISDTLSSIITNLSNAYSQIGTMGGTIPLSKNMENLPSAIGTIPQSGGGADTLGSYFGKTLTSANYANVYSLPSSFFEDFTTLQTVSLPNCSIIGQSTFYGCDSLSSIVLSTALTSIPASAFYNCASLTSYDFPSLQTSMEYIGNQAFSRTGINQTFNIEPDEIGGSIATFSALYYLGTGNPFTYSYAAGVEQLNFGTSEKLYIPELISNNSIKNIVASNATISTGNTFRSMPNLAFISASQFDAKVTFQSCGNGGTLSLVGSRVGDATGNLWGTTTSGLNYSYIYVSSPTAIRTGSSAFYYAAARKVMATSTVLTTVEFVTDASIYLGSAAFYGNAALSSIVLNSPYVASIPGTTAAIMSSLFGGLPASYKVYVPASLYSSYKSNTGWGRVSTHLVSF